MQRVASIVQVFHHHNSSSKKRRTTRLRICTSYFIAVRHSRELACTYCCCVLCTRYTLTAAATRSICCTRCTWQNCHVIAITTCGRVDAVTKRGNNTGARDYCCCRYSSIGQTQNSHETSVQRKINTVTAWW